MYRNRNPRNNQHYRSNHDHDSGHAHPSHDHSLCGHDHDHSLGQEFLCHIPLAVVSLAISFVVAAVIKSTIAPHNSEVFSDLFHTCHYAHLLFASIGTATTFFRFSSRISFFGVACSAVIPLVFCTLSDVILPTVGVRLLGIPINMHLCIMHVHELFTVGMFLFCGVLAGICLANGEKQAMRQFAKQMHFFHIFASTLAALFYMILHGMHDFVAFSGILLIVLLISVVIPCTFSDCLVPLTLGRWHARRLKAYHGENK